MLSFVSEFSQRDWQERFNLDILFLTLDGRCKPDCDRMVLDVGEWVWIGARPNPQSNHWLLQL